MRRWLVAVVFGAALVARLATAAGAQSSCYAPQEAAAHIGEYACVSGRVTFVLWAQQSNGRPTFVDMGSRFTVIIWEEDHDHPVKEASHVPTAGLPAATKRSG